MKEFQVKFSYRVERAKFPLTVKTTVKSYTESEAYLWVAKTYKEVDPYNIEVTEVKAKDRFDLEENIMSAWAIIDDIKDLSNHIANSRLFESLDPDQADEIKNQLSALEKIYGLKFNKLWSTFEELIENDTL